MSPNSRSRFRAVLFGPGVAAAVLLAACGGAGSGGDRAIENLLLVTLDTTRADRLGCYGAEGVETPRMDLLAREGVLFENCISVGPVTLPSHASILTGQYPFAHGARNNGTHFLPVEATTLAEDLAAAGFETGAVVSAFVLDARFGLDQGFEAYDDNLTGGHESAVFLMNETAADRTVDRALAWLDGKGERPWFLWTHFFDPHAEYRAPEPYCSRLAPYDAEIAFTDAQLGRLLDALEERGELERTLVVITADHGESLGDHGETTHGVFVYDATTRVPLILSHPSLAAGKRISEVVSGVDIAPTCLALLGLDTGRGFDGRSLAEASREALAQVEPRPVYSESMMPLLNHGWSDLRAVRDAHGRYIRAPRSELYALESDPREERNLLPGAESRAVPYLQSLERFLAEPEVDSRSSATRDMDAETRASLAALGYVWSAEESGPEPAADLPDPKDRVHLWEREQYANELVRAGRHEEAVAAFKAYLDEDPGSITARTGLAGAWMLSGRDEAAAEVLRETVQLPGALSETFLFLATLEHKLGDARWEEHLLAAKELAPRDPYPWVVQGGWAQAAGDGDAAVAAYRAAIERDEGCLDAWIGLGNSEHRRGRELDALRAFERAVEVDPHAPEAWYNLGVVYDALARLSEALESYARAHELSPEDPAICNSMATVLARSGKRELAEARFREALALKPDYFDAQFGLGVLLMQARKPAEALVALTLACELAPDDMRAQMAAIRACLRLAREEDALRRMRAAYARQPEQVQALVASDPALASLLERVR